MRFTTARTVRNGVRPDKSQGRTAEALEKRPSSLWTSPAFGLTPVPMGSKPSNKESAGDQGRDVVLVYGRSDDGQGYDVLRQKGEEIQAGTMRPLVEGKPIHGEVVRLKPRNDSPVLFDVQVQHETPSSLGRPAKVATERYRRGWESIWANKQNARALN